MRSDETLFLIRIPLLQGFDFATYSWLREWNLKPERAG